MTIHMNAMAAALAMRDACRRCIDTDRPIDHVDIGAVVAIAMRDAASYLPCPDDVFEGIAKAIQAQSRCTGAVAFDVALRLVDPSRPFAYSRWRHGGWYVSDVRYPSGACGCVSNNYLDKKWRIVCDGRRQDLNEPGDVTFRSREEAARAEQVLALEAWTAAIRSPA
ncbi:hypothetical protein [Ottowia sp.]|jgi:hypothetical protein|uniref:hypothetical protein n=1 Tax=Ottowia sp. TaxID=1898956 RepID=UPI00262CDF06|nr:hypothetical protein [Ottowia sp.]